VKAWTLFRFTAVAACLAGLAFAAGALGGTATVNDGEDAGLAACDDIAKVHANADNDVTTFKVVMLGAIDDKPCNGNSAAGISTEHPTCSIGPTEGDPHGQDILCGGKSHPAKVTRDPKNAKAWDIKFKTKYLPGKPHHFKFIAYSKHDETLAEGWTTIQVG
jgi:hypothetical protein